jgi:hypothetical protein
MEVFAKNEYAQRSGDPRRPMHPFPLPRTLIPWTLPSSSPTAVVAPVLPFGGGLWRHVVSVDSVRRWMAMAPVQGGRRGGREATMCAWLQLRRRVPALVGRRQRGLDLGQRTSAILATLGSRVLATHITCSAVALGRRRRNPNLGPIWAQQG